MLIRWTTDPVTRYVRVAYDVPADAPDQVRVQCRIRTDPAAKWIPASVSPHASDQARARPASALPWTWASRESSSPHSPTSSISEATTPYSCRSRRGPRAV